MKPESDMLAEAQEMLKAKRFAEAEVLLRKLLADQATRRPRVGVLLAKTLLGLGKRAEAEAVLSQAMLDWPRAPGPRLHYAQLCAARGDFGEAAATLEGVAADRLTPEARLLLARVNLKLGHVRKAVEMLQSVKTPWPKRVQALALATAVELFLRCGNVSGEKFLETARVAWVDPDKFDQQLARRLTREAKACWFENRNEQAVVLLQVVASAPALLEEAPALNSGDILPNSPQFFAGANLLYADGRVWHVSDRAGPGGGARTVCICC